MFLTLKILVRIMRKTSEGFEFAVDLLLSLFISYFEKSLIISSIHFLTHKLLISRPVKSIDIDIHPKTINFFLLREMSYQHDLE